MLVPQYPQGVGFGWEPHSQVLFQILFIDSCLTTLPLKDPWVWNYG